MPNPHEPPEFTQAREKILEIRTEHVEGVRNADQALVELNEMAVIAVQALEKSHRERRHLKLVVGVLVGLGVFGSRALDWVNKKRATVITGLSSAAVTAAGATIICQTAETEAQADAPRPPAIAAPPAQPERTPPTTKPPDVPRRAAPLPSPKPTEIPDLQIPTTPLPTGIAIDSPIVKIPPGRTKLPRPPKVTPPVQPPTNPPGQTDSDTSDENCLIKIHIGDLKFC